MYSVVVADSGVEVSAGGAPEESPLGAGVGSVAGGGMTFRLSVAPHSSRGVPVGQQPASVQ